jgi:hypothetical protein
MTNSDLKECRECKKPVSQFAKTCPNCGISNPAKPASFFEKLQREAEKNKGRNKWVNAILAIVVILVILAKCSSEDSSKTNTPPKTAEQISIEKQFSPWDGKHLKLYQFLKENLKDPDSLEHIETEYKKNFDKNGQFNNTLTVTTKYRAKNSFGGYVVEQISADCDIDGNIIKIHSPTE